ncbi:MAG: hypothetical protein AAFV53_23035 [Myxococcota bacterium]
MRPSHGIIDIVVYEMSHACAILSTIDMIGISNYSVRYEGLVTADETGETFHTDQGIAATDTRLQKVWVKTGAVRRRCSIHPEEPFRFHIQTHPTQPVGSQKPGAETPSWKPSKDCSNMSNSPKSNP